MSDRLTLSNALLAPFLPTVPVPTGSLIAFDGVSMNYRFDIFAIYERPFGARAVYVFARWTTQGYLPLYIGKAESLRERLGDHERLTEAMERGATHLLVHIPRTIDPIRYDEAERRLIRHFTPPLNTQHNPLWGGW